MSKFEVRGKNVLLTGASSGIGKELALLFAQDGANLIIDSRPHNRSVLDSWADELRKKFNINVWPFHINLTDEKGPEKLYETAREAAGKIDALINDAGTFHYGCFSEIDYEQQELMVKTNVMAVFKLTRLALPDMIKAGEGRIMNITSCSAFQPTVYHAAYGATNSFVQTMSEAVDAELKGTGVRVLTFSPPYTKTPLLKAANLPERIPWFSVSGLWDPAVIARKGYQAFREGKTICIPGPMNWLMHSIIIRLSPHSLVNAVSLWALKSSK
ncbi:MAG: SDR family NAD(P)-dependent oxidoreductase [Chloroflexi bacterium]|nr:SDR family NAD(P)-dependent oxidoreductase [Chloroflexota bacterium]